MKVRLWDRHFNLIASADSVEEILDHLTITADGFENTENPRKSGRITEAKVLWFEGEQRVRVRPSQA